MIGAAIRKDVWLLLRDRGQIISLFLLPIAFIVAFGLMFGGNGRGGTGAPRTVALWHAPGDARGESVAASLAAAPGFQLQRSESVDEVRRAVADDRAIAGLIVPAQREQPVELSIDLGAPVQVVGPVQGALAGVVMRALAPPMPPGMGPLVEARTPPGIAKPLEQASSFQLTVPGNAVLFGFFIALTVAMTFATEKRAGTWRRLLAAPVPRWKALLATLVPFSLIGACQLAFLFGIGAAAFGMQVAGSISALVAISLCVVYCAVALGLVMGALGGSERQLGGIGSVVLLVMGMIGGCMFPRMLMPSFMKSLGLAVPHGWALDGYYAVLVRQGTTIADIAPQLGALFAFGTGFALIGILLFRFER